MLHNPVIGGVSAFGHRHMPQHGIGRRAQAAIGDDGDGEAMPRRHLFDFRFYGTGIPIHVELH